MSNPPQTDPESPVDYETSCRWARTLCDPALLSRLRTPRPRVVLLATLALWVQLIAAWAAALLGPPTLWLPAFVVICACVPAMELWVHDSAHYSLFRDRKLNDLWATVFFASPVGMSVKTYRRYHMTHHAYLSTPRDMDRFAFNVDVRGARGLCRVLLRGFSGLEGLMVVAGKYLGAKPKEAAHERDWSLVATAGWNLLLLAGCALAGRWYLYFALWAYPIVGVAVTINTIRSVAEHLPIGFQGPVAEDVAFTPLTRTTTPRPFEKWLMYQANFNYHFEHHLYPAIPGVNLPELHRHLVGKGFYGARPEYLQPTGIGRFLSLSRETGHR